MHSESSKPSSLHYTRGDDGLDLDPESNLRFPSLLCLVLGVAGSGICEVSYIGRKGALLWLRLSTVPTKERLPSSSDMLLLRLVLYDHVDVAIEGERVGLFFGVTESLTLREAEDGVL